MAWGGRRTLWCPLSSFPRAKENKNHFAKPLGSGLQFLLQIDELEMGLVLAILRTERRCVVWDVARRQLRKLWDCLLRCLLFTCLNDWKPKCWKHKIQIILPRYFSPSILARTCKLYFFRVPTHWGCIKSAAEFGERSAWAVGIVSAQEQLWLPELLSVGGDPPSGSGDRNWCFGVHKASGFGCVSYIAVVLSGK